jgi:hypothetical protein
VYFPTQTLPFYTVPKYRLKKRKQQQIRSTVRQDITRFTREQYVKSKEIRKKVIKYKILGVKFQKKRNWDDNIKTSMVPEIELTHNSISRLGKSQTRSLLHTTNFNYFVTTLRQLATGPRTNVFIES